MLTETKAENIKLSWVDCLSKGLEYPSMDDMDIVLLDLSLPDSQGLETFTKLHERIPSVPIVVLSGVASRMIAIMAVKEGAQDYLVKGQINGELLVRSIHYSIERKKTERKIEQQNIKLKKLDNIKSQVLNVTSHELRTPISAMKGYLQMLLKQSFGELNEEQKKSVEIILRNANRLDHLIQDILDVSRLESGTMKFIPEKTDVNKMVEEIAETMKTPAEPKHIKVDAIADVNVSDLLIDEDRIKQVIVNLVNNAIKFSPKESDIHIRTKKKDDDTILFEVQDFGRGIPKDKQDAIFETFYQVDSSTDVKFGGAGLGLSISRGIVLAHGGEIWVESEEKKGSTFTFTLPVKPVRDVEGTFRKMDIFGIGAKEL